jgi:predicted DCC family thiol-disulfide oxidoreductase YuxK/general stress protein CsbA
MVSSRLERGPVLLYDGNCGFCRIWVEFWRELTGARVEYLPWQNNKDSFPGIPTEDLGRGVQLIEKGRRWSNAEAITRLLARVPEYSWMDWVYRKIPGFGFIAEFAYQIVSAQRNLLYGITRALWGSRITVPAYTFAAGLLARGLPVIYLIAFFSLAIQVRGLLGSSGILPVGAFTAAVWEQFGPRAPFEIPSLFLYFPGDATLVFAAWAGVVLSIGAALLRPHSAPQRVLLALLWLFYLSFVAAGQTFFSYQWDYLLLESGFLTIFLQPLFSRIWLFHWLAFRLMFESGAVKLLSHDPTWGGLTALAYHYWTQPLPAPLAWYANLLPMPFHRFSTAAVLAGELGLPFLIFAPRRLRYFAAFGIITLQVLILLTGNYTFFNLLTITICLSLLDDSFFGRRRCEMLPSVTPRCRIVSAALFLFVVVLGASQLAGMFGSRLPGVAPLAASVSRFGLVNEYGLFANMTTSRGEIEIEGSNDGENWKAYVFRHKPGPVERAPTWVAPHQPRLDWQMWFAALGRPQASPWFSQLILRLFQASPSVLVLFEIDPFGGKQPKYLRAEYYDYRFSTPEVRRRTGAWWERERKGEYIPAVTLRR